TGPSDSSPRACRPRSSTTDMSERSVSRYTATPAPDSTMAMRTLVISVRRKRRVMPNTGLGRSLLAQHVAHAAHRMDQAPFALALQLAPQVANVDVDDVAAAGVLGPDLLFDLVAAEHLAGVAGE